MLAHLADVSIRSILLALPAATVLWILQSRRTAALQHAVWAVVVCGMLALFAFGQALPRLPLRILDRPAAAVPATPPAVFANPTLPDEASEAAQLLPRIPAKPSHSIDWTGVAVFGYIAIAFAFPTQFVTGMLLIRRLLATALVARGHALRATVYESAVIAVPLTVGWLRPGVLLPLEWREWSPEKLAAVLAHEGAHVRRRDGLVAALAAVNRCVFWFHPLAWMLERKLALLAEQACDESCVALLGNRERYAHLLLEMALVLDGSQGRLRRYALTMAAGSHIRQRIDSLLQEGRTFSRGLTWTGWLAVALCGIPLVIGAGAVELDRQAQSLGLESLELPRWRPSAPPLPDQRLLELKLPEHKPVLLAQAQTATAQTASPQSPVATPKFEVASVKPCKDGMVTGGGGRGGSGGNSSSGRLVLNCRSVKSLIETAYASGMPLLPPIEGEPAWIDSERYTIEAEAEGSPSRATMRGPMLQALLADRFQLKTHLETRQVSAYSLTVAKGGPKLKPHQEGSCVDLGVVKPLTTAPPPHVPGERPVICGVSQAWKRQWAECDVGSAWGESRFFLPGPSWESPFGIARSSTRLGSQGSLISIWNLRATKRTLIPVHLRGFVPPRGRTRIVERLPLSFRARRSSRRCRSSSG